MKQALAARAALQVTNLAFNSATAGSGSNSNFSNSSLQLMPELQSNAGGGVAGSAGVDAGSSSRQVTGRYSASGLYMQQQQEQQRRRQQQQLVMLQQELAGLQEMVSEGLMKLM
jgi:transcription initiation factor TFIID subunit TAF12